MIASDWQGERRTIICSLHSRALCYGFTLTMTHRAPSTKLKYQLMLRTHINCLVTSQMEPVDNHSEAVTTADCQSRGLWSWGISSAKIKQFRNYRSLETTKSLVFGLRKQCWWKLTIVTPQSHYIAWTLCYMVHTLSDAYHGNFINTLDLVYIT